MKIFHNLIILMYFYPEASVIITCLHFSDKCISYCFELLNNFGLEFLLTLQNKLYCNLINIDLSM